MAESWSDMFKRWGTAIGDGASQVGSGIRDGAVNVSNRLGEIWKHRSPGLFIGGFSFAMLLYGIAKGFLGEFLGPIVGVPFAVAGFILGMPFGQNVIDPWIPPEYGGTKGTQLASAPVQQQQITYATPQTFVPPPGVYPGQYSHVFGSVHQVGMGRHGVAPPYYDPQPHPHYHPHHRHLPHHRSPHHPYGLPPTPTHVGIRFQV